MAQLAIKGHQTRGKEVIELLEMLGGKNKLSCFGESEPYAYYIIDEIIDCDEIRYLNDCIIYTLEQFLEKFPYKVEDKAFAFGNKCTIIDAVWDVGIDEVVYTIKLYTSKYTTTKLSSQLQPYKEESMKDYLITEEDYEKTLEVEQEYIDAAERLMNQLAESTHWKCGDFDSQKMLAMFLKKNTSIITEKEDSIIVDIPDGYEFAGFDDDNQQVVFEKVKLKYPKTYRECAEIVEFNIQEEPTIFGYKEELLDRFQKLLICRDAYWKLIGWNPKIKGEKFYMNSLPSFLRDLLPMPTEEMRYAFHENFKDLIEQCKELL